MSGRAAWDVNTNLDQLPASKGVAEEAEAAGASARSSAAGIRATTGLRTAPTSYAGATRGWLPGRLHAQDKRVATAGIQHAGCGDHTSRGGAPNPVCNGTACLARSWCAIPECVRSEPLDSQC